MEENKVKIFGQFFEKYSFEEVLAVTAYNFKHNLEMVEEFKKVELSQDEDLKSCKFVEWLSCDMLNDLLLIFVTWFEEHGYATA